MSTSTIGNANISALIQVQQGSVNTHSLDSLRRFQASAGTGATTGTEAEQQRRAADLEKATDAANQFEALLIHNMLKSMRKTTMSENTSNQKAMYDDMLDQKLADTMVEAGGLGVAKQMISQLQNNNGVEPQAEKPVSANGSTHEKLRALLDNIPRAESVSYARTGNNTDPTVTDVTRLRMASSLWGAENTTNAQSAQTRFIEPLKPLAQQTAIRLGTTTNAVLAVAALETGWGQSMIKNEAGQDTHNYFGIKASNSDKSYTVNTTTEYLQGKPQTVQARFKSYDDPADGINGFAEFILNNPRYSTALEHAGDPERFLAEIHKAGYATDPEYSRKAISILHQIDSRTPLL